MTFASGNFVLRSQLDQATADLSAKLAAKDREIAELSNLLDEVRQQVTRLCKELIGIRDATHKSAITLRGIADHVIAAVPEHLRPK